MIRLPVPLLLTATNSSRCGDQQREVQALSAAELRLLQVIPSGDDLPRWNQLEQPQFSSRQRLDLPLLGTAAGAVGGGE